MRLEEDYYIYESTHMGGRCGVFHIKYCPECAVFKGHFPGNPICPGVCNIQMIKECCEKLTGESLIISNINKCRFTAVTTPEGTPELYVTLSLAPVEGGYIVVAHLSDDNQQYINFKGEMRRRC
ncbi:MAG: beta-hydroxyacyl-ACP dehydratase [Prevotella sp.]